MKHAYVLAVIAALLLVSVAFAGDFTTRFPNGVATDELGDLWGNSPVPDPTSTSGFMEDFYFFTLAEWDTLSQVAFKSLTLADGQYGQLFVQADTSTDYRSAGLLQTSYDNFQFNSGKEFWFGTRFKIGDVDSTEFFCGIYDFAKESDTDSLGVVRDGVYFHKGIGTSVVLAVYDDSTGSTISVATAADSTFIEAGFYYDGEAQVSAFLDGEFVGSVDTSNVPFDTSMPAVFGVICRNDTSSGADAAPHVWMDYITPWQE